MKENSFVFDKTWHPFARKLDRDSMTLSHLRELEDDVLLLMQGENEVQGFKLLEKIEEKRRLLSTKTVTLSEFEEVLPLACEFDPSMQESTFSSRMLRLAKVIGKKNLVAPFVSSLNSTQQQEILMLAGEKVSPEVLGKAIEEYVKNLSTQIKAAEAFFLGRVETGKRLLSKIPNRISEQINTLILEISAKKEVSMELLVLSILYVVELQMGLYEE